MQLAAEAIQDSERIMLGRQRLDHIANIDINSGGNRSALRQSLEAKDKLVWDPSKREDDFSVFARKEPVSDVPSEVLNSKSRQVGADRRSDSDELDDDGEENKLAALNEILKHKKFQITREEEEDFEMFLKKLNDKR